MFRPGVLLLLSLLAVTNAANYNRFQNVFTADDTFDGLSDGDLPAHEHQFYKELQKLEAGPPTTTDITIPPWVTAWPNGVKNYTATPIPKKHHDKKKNFVSFPEDHIVRSPLGDEDLGLVKEFFKEENINKTGQLRYSSLKTVERGLIKDIVRIIAKNDEYMILLNNPSIPEVFEMVKGMLKEPVQEVLQQQIWSKVLAVQAYYKKFYAPMNNPATKEETEKFLEHLKTAAETQKLTVDDTVELGKKMHTLAFLIQENLFEDKLKELEGMLNEGNPSKNKVSEENNSPLRQLREISRRTDIDGSERQTKDEFVTPTTLPASSTSSTLYPSPTTLPVSSFISSTLYPAPTTLPSSTVHTPTTGSDDSSAYTAPSDSYELNSTLEPLRVIQALSLERKSSGSQTVAPAGKKSENLVALTPTTLTPNLTTGGAPEPRSLVKNDTPLGKSKEGTAGNRIFEGGDSLVTASTKNETGSQIETGGPKSQSNNLLESSKDEDY